MGATLLRRLEMGNLGGARLPSNAILFGFGPTRKRAAAAGRRLGQKDICPERIRSIEHPLCGASPAFCLIWRSFE